MPLSVGDKLGPYEILAHIGAGGMGEVYKACDSKLEREVAIKVLPAALARDPERLARFEREAKVLGSLNHPNIAQIYGIEESDAGRALVMELVPGETLQGPLQLETALNYAKQIADALEAAHEKGIVHRDLKPANIMITPAGVVKVLDFGLAAMTQPSAGGSGNPSNSPTLTMGATQAGMILGTAGYMSPEQAAGKPVDKRADIWSFGVVLWEMLTGEQLFKGETVSHILASVLKDEPDLTRLQPNVRRLLRRCLEKDPKKRLRDISVAMELLEEAPAAPAPSRTRFGWAAWAVAAAAILMAAGIAFVHFRETTPDERVLRFSVPPPANTIVGYLAISPDGHRLVVGGFSADRNQLWLRSLDSQQFQPLSGTVNGRSPFWSPDSRYIGFFADGKLKTVLATGGPAQTLCGEAGLGGGGAWNRDGVILFGSDTGPLRRVGAAGGECVPVTKGDQATREAFPEFLPDGRHFLYFHPNAKDESLRGVYVAALDNPDGRKVLSDNSSAFFAPSSEGKRNGHLLFLREGNLMAQPFDTGALQTIGDPSLVAAQASPSAARPQVAASLASNGTLVYLANRSLETQLTWLDRSGRELGKVGPRAEQVGISLSPDGNVVAAGRRNQGLFLYDLVRGSETRFSTLPTSAVWSPDSSRIVQSSPGQGLAAKLASGTGSEELLLKNAYRIPPSDWSRDGRFLIYTSIDAGANGDIWYLPDPGKPDSKPLKFLATDALESEGQLSPDGHWIAYVSNETGSQEAYVRPFPSGPGQWRASVNGGREPRWSRDGKELFFLEQGAPDNLLLAVGIQPDGHGGLKVGTPQKLFGFRALTVVPLNNIFAYSPHPDGKRFLVNVSAETAEQTINIITNWQAGQKQ